jgi:hypothetical protein
LVPWELLSTEKRRDFETAVGQLSSILVDSGLVELTRLKDAELASGYKRPDLIEE